MKLADIQRLALVPPYKALVMETEDEEPPEDLIPPEVVAAAEASRAQPEKEMEPETKREPPKRGAADISKADEIPDQNTLFRLCYEFWKMQPNQVRKELGGAIGKPWDAFTTIRALKEEKP
jgi:hypothetical protein